MKYPRGPLPSPSATLALSLLFAMASQGCGRAAPQQANQIPAHNLKEAQLIAKRGQLTCADSQNCPEPIGLLTISDTNAVSMCTSFLIAPDLMATNNHCIPDDLKQAGSDCSDRMWVRFADAPGRPGEQAGCKSIIKAGTKPGLSDPDYAFFRLDRALTRLPLAVSHLGLPDGAQYTVNKVNPVSKSEPIGSLEQVRCKTPQRSWLIPEFNTDWATLATVADCEIVHGNSGSPLLDDTGQVRGIIQETVVAEKLKENLAKQDVKVLDGDVAPLGVATNFACIRLPSEPQSAKLSSGCGTPGSPESTDWRKNSEKEGMKLIAQWNASASPAAVHIDWSDASVLPDTDTFTVAPHCFKPVLGWQDKKLPTQILEVDLPVWTVTMGANRYLQSTYRYTLNSRALHAQLHFSPAQLGANGLSAVTLTTAGPLTASQTLFDGAIPVCH